MVRYNRYGLFAMLVMTVTADAGAPEKAKRPPHDVTPLYGQVYVLCVGVNTYPYVSHLPGADPTLDTPEKTASALATIFRERFGYQARALVGDVAKEAFEKALDHYVTVLTPEDALILFVSLHGASVEHPERGFEGFLVPHDARVDLGNTADYETWQRQAISMNWLGDRCQAMKARHVLILVEACFSGYLGVMGSHANLPRSHEILAGARSRAAITGGTRQQVLRDGIFGDSVIASLKSLDRAVTARELHLMIRDRVMERVGDAMRPQYRELLQDHGEFLFIPRTVPLGEVAGQAKKSAAAVSERMGDPVTLLDVFAAESAIAPRFTVDPLSADHYWQSSFARFGRYANAGDPIAMGALYYCYAKGLGTEKSADDAFFWARECYHSNHPMGRSLLGSAYKYGVGVARNAQASHEFLSAGAAAGCPIGRARIASDLIQRATSEHDAAILEPSEVALLDKYTVDISKYRWGAGKGLRSVAMRQISGITRDRDEALRLIQEASDLGDTKAMFELCLAYRNGIPGQLAQDIEMYRKLLGVAAGKGNAVAQWYLGSNHASGNHEIAKNCEKAFAWLSLSAEQDFPEGLIGLAALHETGCGTPPDLPRALVLYERAADLGFPPAYALASIYYWNGTVVPRDDERAFRYASMAATSGDPLGCFRLGESYYRLRGVPGLRTTNPEVYAEWRDTQLHRALYWYIRAAENGSEQALERMMYFRFPEGRASSVFQSEGKRRSWERAWRQDPCSVAHYGGAEVLERLEQEFPGMLVRLKALGEREGK